MMLEIDKLYCGYGIRTVLQDISLNIKEGEMKAVIGPNTAGKSTLFKSIMGQLKPSSGSITFLGTDISKISTHQIVQLGITLVPEGRQLFGEMTISENLLLGSYRARQGRAGSFEMVYELFPWMKQYAERPAQNLSGGQQVMLALARGLMSMPKLLLLDEPTQGLSPLMLSELSKALESLRKHGTSILVSEQNARWALGFCDYGYVMVGGVFLFQGESKSLQDDQRLADAYLGKLSITSQQSK